MNSLSSLEMQKGADLGWVRKVSDTKTRRKNTDQTGWPSVVVGQAALAAALARDLDLSAYSLCGMYPDIETSNTATMIVDGVVAPKKMYDDGSEGSFVAE
ncbi:hypothetical protein Tco_0888675, partial [Tanacetum coccineum]